MKKKGYPKHYRGERLPNGGIELAVAFGVILFLLLLYIGSKP